MAILGMSTNLIASALGNFLLINLETMPPFLNDKRKEDKRPTNAIDAFPEALALKL